MASETIKALTFDTGGTILDWHSGFSNALSKAGKKHGIDKDWATLTNELRRRTLKLMLNQGENGPPIHNIDSAHRHALDEILEENGLAVFDEKDRHDISWTTPHNFNCWPDFPSILPKLRENFIVASFTILSFRLIIDTARCNGLSWDVVISCEGIEKYKLLPEAYRKAAQYLQIKPEECCMVACHNFDLDAARAVGFKTAFVHRPDEWGLEGPPDPEPNPNHTIIADDFPDMARALGVM